MGRLGAVQVTPAKVHSRPTPKSPRLEQGADGDEDIQAGPEPPEDES